VEHHFFGAEARELYITNSYVKFGGEGEHMFAKAEEKINPF